jgi:hypothetical protein
MSYTVRDDNATFGPLASVEYPNGAGASTIGCIQNFEPIEFLSQIATNFPASSFNTVFIAPPGPSTATSLPALGQKYQVAGISVYYHTAATGAATMLVEICPAGTVDGSGNNVLSAASFALNTAQSSTPFNLALNTNVDNLIVLPGGRININSGATATTGLVGFAVMVYLIRTA